MTKLSLTVLLSCAAVIQAVPAPQLLQRQSITTVSSSTISSYTPYTWFASAAYCPASQTKAWNCGPSCSANPGFIPVASGGDGDATQYWYVGFAPAQGTVIVAHQGTDPSEIESLATDADAYRTTLDTTLFPGLSSSIGVHDGFASEQSKTATQVLAAVKTAISAHSAKTVTLVGHSLGAALALLDSVYLPLHISGVSFKTVVYGLPRVGNPTFANYVDAHVTLTHINNKEDPIPTVPGISLGYAHPSGEVHIMDSGSWVNCPGHDNPSTECIVGAVPEIWDGTLANHDGPYNGITMGTGC